MMFLNQKGNLLVTISFLLLISAGVAAFVMNNKRVSEAVRTLDGLQLQNVIKGDLQKNIKNILENSSNCNQPEIVGMRNQFANVAYTGSSALRKEFHFSDPHQAFDNVFVQCLLTPAKFEPDENSESLGPEQLDIRHFKLEIVKINTVNLSNVFIDLSAIVTLGLKAKNGGFTNYKYNMKFRVSPKSMNDYGLIFTEYNGNRSLFNSVGKTTVTVFGKTLVAKRQTQTPSIRLKDFTNIDKAQVSFSSEVEIEGKHFVVDTQFADLVNNGDVSIRSIFHRGVTFNPKLSMVVKKPWELHPERYKENYWYQFMHKAYVLPELNSPLVAVNRQTSTYYKYGFDENTHPLSINTKDTGEIFDAILGYEKKDISKTCASGKRIQSGIFDTLVFNNLSEDFTIDFTQNNDEENPPYFCGAVAAKSIRVKLNTSNNESLKKNYLIGKFIVKENIIIEGGSGRELVIIDSSNADSSQLAYKLPDAAEGQSIDSIGYQLYMQKFYQTQNFFLFMFKQEPPNEFFQPRTLKSFFKVEPAECGTTTNPLTDPNARCLEPSIPTPEPDEIRSLHNNFYYEVMAIE